MSPTNHADARPVEDPRARLRAVQCDDGLDELVRDVEAILAILGLLESELRLSAMSRPARGSAIVGIGDDVVMKMMAPHDRPLAMTERSCLDALRGALPVPTPALLATGELEGWSWTLMSRLRGRELLEVWPTLAHAEKHALATQLGECLATLHALEAPDAVERVDWDSWRAERIPALGSVQRERGCPAILADQLEAFVTDSDTAPGRTGWLHTEVMLDHLLVTETTRGWRLSGLFDFEPSWVAPVHYEFASVGLFISQGDKSLLTEILRASGNEASPRRLFAMTALHRYCNLAWFHRRLGGPLSPAGLAEAWFGQ